MNTLTNMESTIDAIKEVSSNALLKHGHSRSRQRLFDLSKTLDQAWQNYKVVHGKTYYKELCLFVITRSHSFKFLIKLGMYIGSCVPSESMVIAILYFFL